MGKVAYCECVVAAVILARRKKLQALLRQVRLDAGLTQTEVAARIGQRPSYVSKYELGEHRLDLPQLEQVCDALGIPLEAFVRRYQDTP